MREFVAVEVGGDPGRASAPEHLTLRFLGEVAPDRNEALRVLLEPVGARHAPFVMRLEGVGAFPDPARPRVVWIGVTTGRDELLALAYDVRAALGQKTESEARGFVPHLTLFRVRTERDRAAARDLLAGHRPAPPPRDVSVERFLLKESVLGPGSATHRIVAEFALSGPVRSSP